MNAKTVPKHHLFATVASFPRMRESIDCTIMSTEDAIAPCLHLTMHNMPKVHPLAFLFVLR